MSYMTKVPSILVTRDVKSGEVKWSIYGHLVMFICECFSSLSGFLESDLLAALPGRTCTLACRCWGLKLMCLYQLVTPGLSHAKSGPVHLFGISLQGTSLSLEITTLSQVVIAEHLPDMMCKQGQCFSIIDHWLHSAPSWRFFYSNN